jgi:hypothetical protein
MHINYLHHKKILSSSSIHHFISSVSVHSCIESVQNEKRRVLSIDGIRFFCWTLLFRLGLSDKKIMSLMDPEKRENGRKKIN